MCSICMYELNILLFVNKLFVNLLLLIYLLIHQQREWHIIFLSHCTKILMIFLSFLISYLYGTHITSLFFSFVCLFCHIFYFSLHHY